MAKRKKLTQAEFDLTEKKEKKTNYIQQFKEMMKNDYISNNTIDTVSDGQSGDDCWGEGA